MTEIQFVPLNDILSILAICGAAGLAIAALVAFGPRAVVRVRQRAYDRAAARELVRLELTPTRIEVDDTVPKLLVRGLHPRQRRGFDPLRVGWPSSELRVVWRRGELVWEVEAPRQLAAEFATTHRALHLVLDARAVERADGPAVATAIGSLARPGSWPLSAAEAPGDRAIHRLAAALEAAALPPNVEVRWRVVLRPVDPGQWYRLVNPEASMSPSIGSIVREAIVDGILFRPSGSGRPSVLTPSASERDARNRKRVGTSGFAVELLVEVAGTSFEEAKALLWRLTDATDSLGDAAQQIRWRIVPGPVAQASRMLLGDWEVAQLWYLPDASFDRAELPRPRPLAGALPLALPDGAGIVVGSNGGRPLALPIAALHRHLAVIGSTGSGKSTLLLHLVTGLLDTVWGATVIDPHGDLVNDILERVPERHAGRVHVLRLADRDHPRGFNFLERRNAAETQLVTSEFVELFADLWPRFCGPKMQHYLRNALLTVLSDREPQTVLELVRVLSDEDFRRPYLKKVDDPVLHDFWRTQWPGRGREDQSVYAVLNKLGAFVSYDSIRQVVGQGVSTIRPRTIMDRGDFLLVDLSQVGGDNASIFGAMLIARYDIDALGRQGTDPATRRPHLLVVDEAPRFATRAVGRIEQEGRKFGLAIGLAAQTLGGIGPQFRETLLANAGTLGLMSPGIDDVRDLVPLFAPLTAADLLGMREFELLVKTAGPKGRSERYGGVVSRPPEGDPARAAKIVAASDARDARPRIVVEAEVKERLTAASEPDQPARARGLQGPAQPKPTGE